MNGIMAALYVVGILCAAISHGRLDAFLDEHCEPGDTGCDDFEEAMHGVFSILYGVFTMRRPPLLPIPPPLPLALRPQHHHLTRATPTPPPACIILNMIFSGLACGLFYKAMPHWDATETPATGTAVAAPAAAVEITETVGPKA